MSAAERARRYRARLRARGVRIRTVRTSNPILEHVRFDGDTFLTPGEQDVLRRFCARLGELPCLPQRVAVFGSRARGDAHARSDLDVAVFVGVRWDRTIAARLSAFAEAAGRPYHAGGFGISLRPVPLCDTTDAPFIAAIGPEMETVWIAPK